MTVISSRNKPKLVLHNPQEVLDALSYGIPSLKMVTLGEGQEFLAGMLKSLEHLNIIEDSVVMLHAHQTHYDVAFKMHGDSQFYYTAIIIHSTLKKNP